jgi:hypothetical protein
LPARRARPGRHRGVLRGLHLLLRFLLQAVALVAGDLGLVAEVLRVVAGADGVGVDALVAATSRSIVPSLASRSSALAAEPEKKSSGVVAAARYCWAARRPSFWAVSVARADSASAWSCSVAASAAAS